MIVGRDGAIDCLLGRSSELNANEKIYELGVFDDSGSVESNCTDSYCGGLYLCGARV